MFLPVSFKPSATVTDLAGSVAGTLDSLAQGIAQGAASLGSLGLPESGPGELGDALGALRDSAANALASPVKFLAMTPFLEGVGTRKGDYGYLTPDGALSFLAGRFAEADVLSGEGNADPDEENGLVVLMVAAQTQGSLAEALGAFNAVYPIPDLERACRRAKALATLERDKFVIPKAPAFPPWTEISPQKNVTGQAVAKVVGSMLASGEAAAKAAAAPGAMLAGFAQKQVAKIAQKAADLETLAARMTGGMDAWTGLYVQGKGAAVFHYFSELPMPFDDSFKSTSLLCFYGKPDEVAYFRESFGLCKRNVTHPVCLVCPGGSVPVEWGVKCPF